MTRTAVRRVLLVVAALLAAATPAAVLASSSPTHPFTDVDPDAFYADAVQWAWDNDITTGVSPTEFAPDREITRGEVITFLYRALTDDGPVVAPPTTAPWTTAPPAPTTTVAPPPPTTTAAPPPTTTVSAPPSTTVPLPTTTTAPPSGVVPITHGIELTPENTGRRGAVNAGLVGESYAATLGNGGSTYIDQDDLDDWEDLGILTYEDGVPVVTNVLFNGSPKIRDDVPELTWRYSTFNLTSSQGFDSEKGIQNAEWSDLFKLNPDGTPDDGKAVMNPGYLYRVFVHGGEDNVYTGTDWRTTRITESILFEVYKDEDSHSDGVQAYGIEAFYFERSAIVLGPPRRGSAVIMMNDGEVYDTVEITDSYFVGGNHIVNSGPDNREGVFTGNLILASSSKNSLVLTSSSRFPDREGSAYTLITPDYVADLIAGVDADGKPWTPAQDGIAEGTPIG